MDPCTREYIYIYIHIYIERERFGSDSARTTSRRQAPPPLLEEARRMAGRVGSRDGQGGDPDFCSGLLGTTHTFSRPP